MNRCCVSGCNEFQSASPAGLLLMRLVMRMRAVCRMNRAEAMYALGYFWIQLGVDDAARYPCKSPSPRWDDGCHRPAGDHHVRGIGRVPGAVAGEDLAFRLRSGRLSIDDQPARRPVRDRPHRDRAGAADIALGECRQRQGARSPRTVQSKRALAPVVDLLTSIWRRRGRPVQSPEALPAAGYGRHHWRCGGVRTSSGTSWRSSSDPDAAPRWPRPPS